MRKYLPKNPRELIAPILLAGLVLIIATALLLVFHHYGLKELITIVGYPGLFAVVFAESGLFFGFFLPGDSLLVTAGLLATQNFFSIVHLMWLLPLAAVLGDTVGYWMGRKFGHRIFNRDKSLLFDPKHLQHAHAFFEKHGGKAIIIARFVPIVRTFTPIVAGMADMHYPRFLSYNIIGGIAWTIGMLLIGFFLGSVIPNVDHYLLPIIALVVVISLIPPFLEVYKHNKPKIYARFMDFVSRFKS